MDEISIRRKIFRHFADTGEAPTADVLGLSADELRELERHHAVVLDGSGAIRFANPFAAPGAPYRVTTPRGERAAICVWDALGVLAALRTDGSIGAECPDCREWIQLTVRGGALESTSTVAHFLLPASRWYEDLGFT